MASASPSAVVALLRGRKLRIRTALWLLPTGRLGQEVDEAARLGIDAIDARQRLLDSLPHDTLYSGLSFDSVAELLDAICASPRGTDCLALYNCDLLLARLTHDERGQVWDLLYEQFPHRARALLIIMPETATALLPSRSRLQSWQADGRLAEN